MKKLVIILACVVLVSFAIGFASLFHFGFQFLGNWRGINFGSRDGNVSIGPQGILVQDGDELVSIGWQGIYVRDGSTEVRIGPEFSWGFDNTKLQEEDVNQEEIVDLDGVKNIVLASEAVSINIIPEEREDLRIHYHGRIRAKYIPELRTEKFGDTVSIRLETGRPNVYTNPQAQLDVFVPSTYSQRIQAKASSASITCNELELDNLSLTTSSGGVKLKELVVESLSTDTSSGGQVVEDVSVNSADLTASSGDINVENFQGRVQAFASSGKIDFHFAQLLDDVKVTASSGAVRLRFPSDAEFNFTATTSSGEVSWDLPMTVSKSKDGHFSGQVGSGTHNVEVKTSSGEVEITGQ